MEKKGGEEKPCFSFLARRPTVPFFPWPASFFLFSRPGPVPRLSFLFRAQRLRPQHRGPAGAPARSALLGLHHRTSRPLSRCNLAPLVSRPPSRRLPFLSSSPFFPSSAHRWRCHVRQAAAPVPTWKAPRSRLSAPLPLPCTPQPPAYKALAAPLPSAPLRSPLETHCRRRTPLPEHYPRRRSHPKHRRTSPRPLVLPNSCFGLVLPGYIITHAFSLSLDRRHRQPRLRRPSSHCDRRR